MLDTKVAGQSLQCFHEKVPLTPNLGGCGIKDVQNQGQNHAMLIQMASVDSLKVDLDQFYLSV